MAAYIDLNPVRAGMVEDPADTKAGSRSLGRPALRGLYSLRDLRN